MLSILLATAPQVITLTAMRFRFDPDRIKIKKDQPIIFRVTSKDRMHGFNIPDMHVRADIHPGEFTELRVDPQKPGKYTFFCDIFCGDGHETMSGVIDVE